MVALETWPVLSRAAVESVTIIVVPLADDFSTAHDDAAMAVMQRGLDGLLQTEGQMTCPIEKTLCNSSGGVAGWKRKALGPMLVSDFD